MFKRYLGISGDILTKKIPLASHKNKHKFPLKIISKFYFITS